MLVDVLTVVAVLLFLWYAQFRPRSTNQRRPAYQSHHTPATLPACDYVVIGAGPAGLAAAAALLQRTDDATHVVLIERGPDPQPTTALAHLCQAGRRDRLLSFAPDLVRTPPEALPGGAHSTFLTGLPDEGLLAQRPWHFSKAEEEAAATTPTASATPGKGGGAAEAKANRYRLLQYAAYPRGLGVGGGALLDWAMHFPSIWPAKTTAAASAPLWTRVPARPPSLCNPLSWAFADTVRGAQAAPPRGSKVAGVLRASTSSSLSLFLDEDNRRLALPAAALGQFSPEVLRRRLSVLTGYTAVDMELGEATAAEQPGGTETHALRRVTGVHVCARPGTRTAPATTTIAVRKGVVIAAGAVHTPRLLHAVASRQTLPLPMVLPSSVTARDVLALPLIFPAVRAVSDDSFNARDVKATVMWWLTQRGPFLMPLANTVLSIPLPQVAPQARVQVVLLPFGGRDPARFKGMGWDTVLGTPLQAYTMLLLLHGIDNLGHPLSLDCELPTPPGTRHARALSPHVAAPRIADEVHRLVQDAFVCAMEVCRALTKEQPIASLTLDPGAESVDFTLLVPADEAKAVRLAQLSRMPPSKRTARGTAELRELQQWSRSVVGAEPYMRRYIDAHAYWLGFASGTSEAFLADAPFRVAGLGNVVVGDASAVTTAMWASTAERNSLAAGSRSTSMDAAERAVAAVLAS